MTQAEFQLAGVLMSSWKPSIVSRIKSIWYEYGFLRIMHKNDQKSFLLHFSYSSKWIASTFQRRASNPLSTSVRCLMVNFRSPCGSLLEARRPSSGVPPWPPLARKGLSSSTCLKLEASKHSRSVRASHRAAPGSNLNPLEIFQMIFQMQHSIRLP